MVFAFYGKMNTNQTFIKRAVLSSTEHYGTKIHGHVYL